MWRWDDRCRPEDAADRLVELYNMGRAKRKELGLLGREWALDEGGFTGRIMGERATSAIDKLFSTWKPRERYEFINIAEVKEDELSHELLY